MASCPSHESLLHQTPLHSESRRSVLGARSGSLLSALYPGWEQHSKRSVEKKVGGSRWGSRPSHSAQRRDWSRSLLCSEYRQNVQDAMLALEHGSPSQQSVSGRMHNGPWALWQCQGPAIPAPDPQALSPGRPCDPACLVSVSCQHLLSLQPWPASQSGEP